MRSEQFFVHEKYMGILARRGSRVFRSEGSGVQVQQPVMQMPTMAAPMTTMAAPMTTMAAPTIVQIGRSAAEC